MSNTVRKSIVGIDHDAQLRLHGDITPAEIRTGEPIRAKIQYTKEGAIQTKLLRVWRLSPIGIELIEEDDLGLSVGHSIDLELHVGASTSILKGVTVITRHTEKNVNLIGVRLCVVEQQEWLGENRRDSKRWGCSREFMPTGVASNPGRFNDFIFFRVADISRTGLLLVTSLRNKFLVPGMKLSCSISLPMVGQIETLVEIVNARFMEENGKEALAVGAKFINLTLQMKEAIGQYIFQFGPETSIAELKANGFIVPESSKSIEYRYARTQTDYEQVLELRRTAYAGAGKLSGDETISDIFDSRSRIVIGVYRGKVIASTRLIYNEIDDLMEHEQYVSFPPSFPRKDEICEITRVCTHPDFRGSDVLLGMFRFIAITVVQSQRKYIIGCATDELLNLYVKTGFSSTGIKYNHAALGNKEHTVIIANVAKTLAGFGISPIYWNVVWGDVVQYVVERGLYNFDSIANVRIGLYKLLRPLSFFLYFRSRRPTKRLPKESPKVLKLAKS